jgi:hypothetical protein
VIDKKFKISAAFLSSVPYPPKRCAFSSTLNIIATNPQVLLKPCGKHLWKLVRQREKRGQHALCSFFEQLNKIKLF